MRRLRYFWPTVAIIAVLAAQIGVTAVAAARKLMGDKPHARTWPFIDYPAYSREHGPILRTDEPMLYAELPDREPIAIDPEFMGLGYYSWRYRLIERMAAPPVDRDQDPAHARLVEQHRAEAYARVYQQIAERLHGPPVRLTLIRTHYTLHDDQLQRTTKSRVLDKMPSTRTADASGTEAP